MDVHIDIDFIEDPKNEKKMEDMMMCLYQLTGWELWIPYKFDKKGFSSSIHTSEEYFIYHPDPDDSEEGEDESPLSFFLEVDPSLGKEKK